MKTLHWIRQVPRHDAGGPPALRHAGAHPLQPGLDGRGVVVCGQPKGHQVPLALLTSNSHGHELHLLGWRRASTVIACRGRFMEQHLKIHAWSGSNLEAHDVPVTYLRLPVPKRVNEDRPVVPTKRQGLALTVLLESQKRQRFAVTGKRKKVVESCWHGGLQPPPGRGVAAPHRKPLRRLTARIKGAARMS